MSEPLTALCTQAVEIQREPSLQHQMAH